MRKRAQWMRGIGAIVVAIGALVLSGCVSTSSMTPGVDDPFEPMNRAVFGFNEKFDRYVELPVAGFYILWLPAPVRHGLDNVLDNLDMPVVFANDVLQGEETQAGKDIARFALNSTVGLGGILDVATREGLPFHEADFGQTLAGYGVGAGPFLVVPILGPDPPRDLLGDAFDVAIDPLTYIPAGWPLYARAGDTLFVRVGQPLETNARTIVLRQELEKSSLDPYVTMRSIYRQMRAAKIAGGYPPDPPAGPK